MKERSIELLGPHPTLEITTIIPKTGCIMNCLICPQEVLKRAYKGERVLTFDNFKLLIDKVPTEVRITFAGFVEPWLNKHATDMLLYAYEKGHKVAVFTTGICMTFEDIERIKDIKYDDGTNGGFVLHIPDHERISKHPITEHYINIIKKFSEIQHEIKGFYTLILGNYIHDDISPHFSYSQAPHRWDRCGNLYKEALYKPELLNYKDLYKSIYHGKKDLVCNQQEGMYHQVLLPNGDVSLCCQDYSLKYILGNLYESDYFDVIPEIDKHFDLCRFCPNGISKT